jgi:cyclopropane fatty-acyl-phospholipid synthase-like methyltransferase
MADPSAADCAALPTRLRPVAAERFELSLLDESAGDVAFSTPFGVPRAAEARDREPAVGAVPSVPLINEAEIVAYYESCEPDYSLVWGLQEHLCMHYGYWEEDTRSLAEAVTRLNEKLVELGRITGTDRVLDAGCGVGGGALFLARRLGCRVHGITLSATQVERCRQNARRHRVEDLVCFERRNYLATGLDDASFDVVWAVESVCYAFDKRDFLREAYRLLRPGGRLVLADFFGVKMDGRSRRDRRLMEKWTRSWAIREYAVTEEFERQMVEAGFRDVVVRDVTRSVQRSVTRLFSYYYPGLVYTYLWQLLGWRNRLQTLNTHSTAYQYRAYRRGLWRYNLVGATKPEDAR